MPKKEKASKKESAPKLAAYVDHSFPIYLKIGEKEREARVLTSGVIVYKDKEHNSPCSAATAVTKELGEKWTANAWTAWKYNKDGERVPLDAIRGTKSPLKKVEAKPRKVKAAKAANGPAKTKRVRKPRTVAPRATEHAAAATATNDAPF